MLLLQALNSTTAERETLNRDVSFEARLPVKRGNQTSFGSAFPFLSNKTLSSADGWPKRYFLHVALMSFRGE